MKDPSETLREDLPPENSLGIAAPDQRTLRQFQVGWVLAFGILAIYHGIVRGHHSLGIGLAGAMAGGAILGWLAPAAFRRVYLVALLLARPIGWVVSQVALALMFFAVLTPLALVFKILRRDRLRLEKPVSAASFWRERNRAADLRRYFRSY
jgi:Saxitoxin biosynthesis operon protein SxtJ